MISVVVMKSFGRSFSRLSVRFVTARGSRVGSVCHLSESFAGDGVTCRDVVDDVDKGKRAFSSSLKHGAAGSLIFLAWNCAAL